MPKPVLVTRVGLLASSVVGCAVLAACGASSSVGPAPAVSTPQPITVTHTVAGTSAGTHRAHRAVKPVKETKSTRAHSMRWTMPNEVGQVLQDAQDDLQRASGDPVFFSHSHDLLGDRFQILDSDWQVCTQNVPPGTRIGQVAHVDFGVVKTYERCP